MESLESSGQTVQRPSGRGCNSFRRPLGLSEIVEDEVHVDLPADQAFVDSVFAEYGRSVHGLFQGMIIGFLGPCLVLLDRAGGKLPFFGSEQEAPWAKLMNEQLSLMPR